LSVRVIAYSLDFMPFVTELLYYIYRASFRKHKNPYHTNYNVHTLYTQRDSQEIAQFISYKKY